MMDRMLPTPVLEIGGTHVTAALVQEQASGWTVRAGSMIRRDLDAHGTAADLLDALAGAANALGSGHNGQWGVALPGPFDYVNGIALYEDVGKFDHLHGVDVRAGLLARLRPAPKRITFLNDADAFGIGEFAVGAAGNSRRGACITLGTGVGSAFLADGVPVKTGNDVPPDGSCYLLEYRNRPLEETVSRRAVRRAYAEAKAAAAQRVGTVREGAVTEEPDAGIPDVREIAEASRAGDAVAGVVLEHAFAAVGEAAGPYLPVSYTI
jgi:glucokinase